MKIYQYVVVRLEQSYGNLRAVPVGPMAQAFARIAGAKTLTPAVLREIDQLGLYVMADGSSADKRAMEQAMKAGDPLYHPVLIDYRKDAEEELDPMMEAHIDSKYNDGGEYVS